MIWSLREGLGEYHSPGAHDAKPLRPSAPTARDHGSAPKARTVQRTEERTTRGGNLSSVWGPRAPSLQRIGRIPRSHYTRLDATPLLRGEEPIFEPERLDVEDPELNRSLIGQGNHLFECLLIGLSSFGIFGLFILFDTWWITSLFIILCASVPFVLAAAIFIHQAREHRRMARVLDELDGLDGLGDTHFSLRAVDS